MRLYYKKQNVQLARVLRKRSTPQENRLWYDFLSAYPVRFHRQKPIGPYIADFYCHRARLVIEIDGAGHESGKDAQRDAALAEAGLHVLRITNRQIEENFRGVCDYIDQTVNEFLK